MAKLVCIGGGEIPRTKNGLQLPYETEEIDKEIVKLAGIENPKMLFIGTACGEKMDYYLAIKEIYENLGCEVSQLELLKEDISIERIKAQILNSNIIYVGGGKTQFMLDKWQELGIDKILLKAYEKDIVISGLSAGSYCWFKYNYDLIQGLGIISAINCVHYEQKDKESKEKFYNVIKEKNMIGIALENCTALEIVNDKYRIIKSNANRNAYKILYNQSGFVTEKLNETYQDLEELLKVKMEEK